ncbi:hypothetical protein SAMN05443668_1011229 [Cryptosporangium aurantiacum]|uniref:Uncharacterized protein n=1 Tax=Cryptosporangium aurantiacum TaxID=134849 RepID=A0A1M7KR30_9ACTN|nr:hypothetical protein SAMN05443668_1011229 [Cryptosporangium aurantiacum]
MAANGNRQDPRSNGASGWHRRYVADDVETARALIAEHVVDPANSRYCGSATHIYPGEWPCYRRSWAELVLRAEARGEIDDLREPA